MSGRVSAYGFLGKWPGSVRHRTYRMPSSVSAPLRHWKLFALALWPDDLSGGSLLLSVKAEESYGHWVELLPTPTALRSFVPEGVDAELAVKAAVPERLRREPGDFHTFVGDTPLAWQRLERVPSAPTWGTLAPRGPVAVRWEGALRGLLLVGMEYS